MPSRPTKRDRTFSTKTSLLGSTLPSEILNEFDCYHKMMIKQVVNTPKHRLIFILCSIYSTSCSADVGLLKPSILHQFEVMLHKDSQSYHFSRQLIPEQKYYTLSRYCKKAQAFTTWSPTRTQDVTGHKQKYCWIIEHLQPLYALTIVHLYTMLLLNIDQIMVTL